MLGAGQFCTKPGLLFLPAGHQLTSALAAAVRAVEPAAMLDARIHSQFRDGVQALNARTDVVEVARGALRPTLASGRRPTCSRRPRTHCAPTLTGCVQEHFGPAGLIVEYADQRDLSAALALVDGSLTATIHANRTTDSCSPT